jgi:hypothetical protein
MIGRKSSLKEVSDEFVEENAERYFRILELLILTFTAFSFMYLSGAKGLAAQVSLIFLLLIVLYSVYSVFILGGLRVYLGEQKKKLSAEWFFYYGDRLAYILYSLSVVLMLIQIIQTPAV